MATLQKLPFLLVLLLSSCAIVDVQEDTYAQRFPSKGLSEASIFSLQSEELKNIQKPQVQPVVAVYGSAFTDQTGQRKSNSEFALFSTAITQQPSTLLIRALKHASNGEFFRVVERVGLDNLVKERQLIRSAREQFAEAEELGLSNYQQFISNIKGTTGRYGEASFQPSIERLSPYVKELSGDTPVTYKLEDIFNRETGTFNEGFSFDKGNVADLRAQGRKNLLYEEPDDNKVKPAATVVPLP